MSSASILLTRASALTIILASSLLGVPSLAAETADSSGATALQ
jgi:hypothetical protein